MFILTGTIASLIVSAIWIFAFIEEKTAGKCIHCIVKNFFVVNLVSIAIQRYVMKYQHFLVSDGYKTTSFIKFFIVAMVVGTAFMFISALINNLVAFEKEEPKKTHGARFVKVISAVFVFLGTAAYFGTIWGKGNFGDVTADQLLITLFSPTEGTETSVYVDGFEGPVFQVMLITALFCLVVFSNFRLVYKAFGRKKVIFNGLWKRIICLVLSVACIAGGVTYGVQEFRLKQLINAYFIKSDLFDENYINPKTASYTFPEKKRNLIFISLESLENSYLSKELGGNMDENLMPELTELAQEGIVFSDTDGKFGGPQQAPGTQWSCASLVNMTSGLPMKMPNEPNSYGTDGNFLPGAYTMMELLRDNGYQQSMMMGSPAKFGGLDFYFGNHGCESIMDYRWALKEGKIPPDYKVWWGYEDEKLYEFAKEELTNLGESGQPFSFIMETADTHRPGGFVTEDTPQPYPSSYANAVAHSTSETVKFVRWIQQQPFYDNTTIVMIGDHISMETDFFEFYGFDDSYHRTQFNLILNPDPSVAKLAESRQRNRLYANYDMFPTMLAGIGVKFDGNRLGVGTNLFSNKDTLFEEYGVDFVNNEMEKKSEIYNNEILRIQDSAPAAE